MAEEASIGSRSSVQLLQDLKYIVFNHVSILLVGKLTQIGRFLRLPTFPKKINFELLIVELPRNKKVLTLEKVFTNSNKAKDFLVL